MGDVPKIICPYCSALNDQGSNYCNMCAGQISRNAPEPQLPAINSVQAETGKSQRNTKKEFVVSFFLSLMVLASIIGVLYSFLENKRVSADVPTTKNAVVNTTEKRAPIITSVDTLVKALENNPLNASNTYKNSYVKIVGKLTNIDSSGKYFSISPIDSEFSFYSVICYITESQKGTVARFKMGQEVTVIGTITEVGEVLGFSMDIETIE